MESCPCGRRKAVEQPHCAQGSEGAPGFSSDGQHGSGSPRSVTQRMAPSNARHGETIVAAVARAAKRRKQKWNRRTQFTHKYSWEETSDMLGMRTHQVK